ncbi:hypothetical protein KFL_000540090 [Klebsormidium nitens]|uniref:Disease resistance R13L4/SHOC-2-like LRR domain-containing protein n=1 Tax=Klebsormidium nitens TaxID=105231 RepID=A0A0U9HI72_KLENI|nr:hypothetical protein KFL_000540090 [Klebsormidium nitens]|eukprot:GAQ80432.1 hypothetical protein KFL_000540090 [Klebsormidium nitens]
MRRTQSVGLLWLLTAVGVARAVVLPLEAFQVDGTHLTLKAGVSPGSLPPEIGTWSNLTRIELVGRGLFGAIPPALGNLTQLQYLDLSHNSLIGPIPAEIGKLDNLVSLNLSYNAIADPIPPQLGTLGALAWLNLFANRITGVIPSELGNLTNLQYLSLATNNLTGPIPAELGKLSKLSQLFLYENHLTGSVITELGNLPNLVTLSLSNNSLSGLIPSSLGNYRLSTVLLSNNSLTGVIPSTLVTRLKNNATYVCLYIKRGNPDLIFEPASGLQCPSTPPPVTSSSPPTGILSTPAPSPGVSGPPPSLVPGPPPPSPTQVNPRQPEDLGRLLGLALALPTGLLSFGLTVAFFVVEVRKHRRAKQAIVRSTISLCHTGARHTLASGTTHEITQPLDRPKNMGDREFDEDLTTILNQVLQTLEAWPQCLGFRGDPTEAVWSPNFKKFEHYVLFRALVDADSRYGPMGLLGVWDTNRGSPEALGEIVGTIREYLDAHLHETWTGSVDRL